MPYRRIHIYIYTYSEYVMDDSEIPDSDSDSDRGLFNINYTWKFYIRFTLQNNTNIVNKYEPDIIKNACWETSTKIIADRFRRGHPEQVGGGGGGGRSWIHVQHVNLRAVRRFTCCP